MRKLLSILFAMLLIFGLTLPVTGLGEVVEMTETTEALSGEEVRAILQNITACTPIELAAAFEASPAEAYWCLAANSVPLQPVLRYFEQQGLTKPKASKGKLSFTVAKGYGEQWNNQKTIAVAVDGLDAKAMTAPTASLLSMIEAIEQQAASPEGLAEGLTAAFVDNPQQAYWELAGDNLSLSPIFPYLEKQGLTKPKASKDAIAFAVAKGHEAKWNYQTALETSMAWTDAKAMTVAPEGALSLMNVLAEILKRAEGPEASIPWKYTVKGGQATITGYKGAAPSGNVWIPREIDGNVVTAIGKQALASCDGITGLTIPDSVTVIGAGAFAGCSGLTSIRIPDGVTTIGDSAFQGCSGLTSVAIPGSVTSIGSGAFAYTDMASVTIPESVTSIGHEAFTRAFHDEHGNVTGFGTPTLVVTEGSVGHQYAIDTNNFYYIFEYDLVDGGARIKRSMSGVIPGDLLIPSELDGYPVTGIGDSAFAWWAELTSVIIPSSVTSIGAEAFAGCYGLTVTIPTSVTSIAKDAFSGEGYKFIIEEGSYAEQYIKENDISSLRADASTPWAYVLEGGGAKIMGYGVSAPTGDQALPHELDGYPVTGIGEYAFADCTALRSMAIPDSVTSIGRWAFSGCSGLTSVTIPASVTSIGDGAFFACEDLATITIPSGVTRIGYRTFDGCRSLTSVTIPDGVGSIGEFAFQYCYGLISVTIPKSVGFFGEKAFDGCDELVLSVEGSSYAEQYAKEQGISYQIGGPEGSGEVFSSSTISIAGWEGILVDGNVKITGYAGDKPTGDLVIPSELDGYAVTAIGDEVFYDCDGLTSVTIPNGVTSIGNHAFMACSGLTSVIIPDNVTSIGSEAFVMCSGLTSVIIGKGVRGIGELAFAWCENLTSVTIPDGVKSIGIQAFGGCTSLTNVTIPASMTSIDHSTFLDCTSLTSVTIPARVRNIEQSAFSGCDNVTLGYFNRCAVTFVTIQNTIFHIEFRRIR